jgi:hypothetical protein
MLTDPFSMLAEDTVLVELKSVESLSPIHTAQMLTYLKLSGKPVGLLINFNVPILKDGIKRVLNPGIAQVEAGPGASVPSHGDMPSLSEE